MRQQRPDATGSLFDPLLTAPGERTVAGKVVVVLRFGGIDQFLAGGVRPVERNEICCHCFRLYRLARGAGPPAHGFAKVGGFHRRKQRPILDPAAPQRRGFAGFGADFGFKFQRHDFAIPRKYFCKEDWSARLPVGQITVLCQTCWAPSQQSFTGSTFSETPLRRRATADPGAEFDTSSHSNRLILLWFLPRCRRWNVHAKG